MFERFLRERLDRIPHDKEPADAYAYNSHMGAFLRALDQAKDEYLKAVHAYYAARDSDVAKDARRVKVHWPLGPGIAAATCPPKTHQLPRRMSAGAASSAAPAYLCTRGCGTACETGRGAGPHARTRDSSGVRGRPADRSGFGNQ